MRTVIPYVWKHPETVAGAGHDAVWAYVGGDDHAYWRLLCEWWERGESFLIVEHDVVASPDIIDELDRCPEAWCAARYDDMCHPECQEAWANMLGCTRFRAELIAAAPDALSSIPEDQRDWHNLCDAIAGDKVGGMPAPVRPGSVRAAGFTHHWHGFVRHHHMGRNEIENTDAVR